MQADTINIAELRSNFAPLESDQGNPGLLKVVNLCPQSDGCRVGGPGIVLGQCVLGLFFFFR